MQAPWSNRGCGGCCSKTWEFHITRCKTVRRYILRFTTSASPVAENTSCWLPVGVIYSNSSVKGEHGKIFWGSHCQCFILCISDICWKVEVILLYSLTHFHETSLRWFELCAVAPLEGWCSDVIKWTWSAATLVALNKCVKKMQSATFTKAAMAQFLSGL